MKNLLVETKCVSNFALKNISCTINCGDRVAVVGNNGAGKTTLLRVLIGNLAPVSGNVIYSNSFNTSKVSWLSSSEQGLFERLSGLENINLFSGLMGIDCEQKVESWSQLEPFRKALEMPFYKCSSGMKQILRIFVMTIHEPLFLFWDEPFKNLDLQSTSFLIDKFWNKDDYTIVYSTHQSEELLESRCTKVFNIKDGEIVSKTY